MKKWMLLIATGMDQDIEKLFASLKVATFFIKIDMLIVSGHKNCNSIMV